MPSLQQQRGENQQQAEGIHRIEAREAGRPEGARRECSLLRAIGIVVSEDEAGKQQEEADRDVSPVHYGTQRSKGFRIGKMEEDQIESGKAADAGKRRQLGSPRSAG